MTMSSTDNDASAEQRVTNDIAAIYDWLADAFHSCVKSYVRHRDRRAAIAYLHSFSDYELRDIGLRRGSIEAAVCGLYLDEDEPGSSRARWRV